MPDATTDALPHGYTVAALQDLARAAASGGDRHDQAAALSGIAERLYGSRTAPEPEDLIRAGRVAIAADTIATADVGDPRVDDPAEQVVETHALRQIWPQLTSTQRRCLLALAEAGDLRTAAAAAGIPLSRFTGYVERARRTVKQLWDEAHPPRPSGARRPGRHARIGHPIIRPVLAHQAAS